MIAELQPYLTVKYIALCGLAVAVFAVWQFRRRRLQGAADLDSWSQYVSFSNQQLVAMRSLWQWHSSGREPAGDPLVHLSPADMADLAQKCSLECKPAEFVQPDEEKERQKFEKVLMQRGMNQIQAEIVTGMKFNMLGPAFRIKRF